MLENYMTAASSDIPRLLTALAEWCSCMICLSLFAGRLRIRGFRLFVWSAALLLVLSFFLVLTEGSLLLLWFPCMVGAFLIIYLFLSLFLIMPAPGILYRTCMTFLVSEFAASLAWQIVSYGRMISGSSHIGLEVPVMILTFALTFGVCRTIYRQYIKDRPPPGDHLEGCPAPGHSDSGHFCSEQPQLCPAPFPFYLPGPYGYPQPADRYGPGGHCRDLCLYEPSL